ncbi:MAG: multicopper oxidase domain-containing protein [Gemmatimonadales bacterium]|nr:multicopper oxidase domain-containing protein [Gemmatimonadales bacterium]
MKKPTMTRRALLARGALGAAGLATAPRTLGAAEQALGRHGSHTPDLASTQGRVTRASIDPTAFLEHFDYGTVTTLPDGGTRREYTLTAVDAEIEVAPGVFYPAWTYNGQVPGPTLRATEGDLLRVVFVNAGTHAHTIHFHGIHPARMDGVYEVVNPGDRFVYEFTARPAGLQLYHCHAIPLKRHIAKGLYGTLIIDPKVPRPPAREMVMVLNGFDTNFDGTNEVYAVNTVPFAYHHDPIRVKKGELQRIYMVNILEFDLINSMHIHGNFFNVFRTGATTSSDFTDTLMFCQGERHIIEFTYEETGRFMFHAHQSEFAELGWMGVFEVVDEPSVIA